MNANTYASPGTTGGNREDLRGPLTILEPEETPFTSLLKKGPSPKATLVEVLADVLRKPRTTGTREGSSGTKGGNKATKRQRFGSYLHRFHDSFGVTDVQQLITEAGGNAATGDEYDWAKSKTIREIKRDMEATFCGSQDAQGGSDAEMRSRGAFKWLDSSQTPAVPAEFQVPSAARLTGKAAILEPDLNGVLKSLKSSYGGPKTFEAICGNDYAEDIDMFTRTEGSSNTQRYTITEMADKHQITLKVKVFDSTFGRVNIIPTEFNRVSETTGLGDPTSMLIINRELWELLMLEELHSADDDPDAGGFSGYVKAICGLFCRHPKGNGSIINS
jgi:hypothetical protein